MTVSRLTIVLGVLMLFAVPVSADSHVEGFDSEKMISELEKQMELSREEWEKLKPVLEEKSREMKKSMHDSIDKGYAELEKLSKQLEAMSKDAELKAKEMLSSEEAQKIREYLSSIDQDAIRTAQEKMVEELTELLELTEQQIAKVKPVLEESIARLSVMLQDLANESSRNWEQFRQQFDQLTSELLDKLDKTLDNDQMERLEEFNEEQKELIQKTLFSV